MLEINNLVKYYGNYKAVDNLSLTIEKGNIFGFVGPNGAGKTTTMKIISGLMSSSQGNVIIDGMDVSRNLNLLRSKIGYMPDFFGVYDNLKVNEYMDFYCGTYKIPYRERETKINDLLEIVNLTDKCNAYVDLLSRGMKQRLCLARSLIHDPELLILDEPASGLDPRARVELKEVLKQLKSFGKTIIISSHILSELAEMCSMVGIIDKGKMVAQGSIFDITKQLRKKRKITIKSVGKIEELVIFLKEQPLVSDIIVNTDNIELDFDGDDLGLSDMLKNIIMRDIPLISFTEAEGNLEDIFMTLTGTGSGGSLQ